jgi:hypothetical protein
MKHKTPTTADLRSATAWYERRARLEPRAEAVSFDPAQDAIAVRLVGGVTFLLPIAMMPELAEASPQQLRTVYAGWQGEAISLDELDVDISVPGLLQNLLGTRSAAALGSRGGRARTAAKAHAARANGKRGGRPRKAPMPAS